MLHVKNNLQHITKAQHTTRNSLTEVNATSQAETTSDRMATIPQNLESQRVIHNSLQVLSSTINMDLPSCLER